MKVITVGIQGIGKCIAEEFKKNGAAIVNNSSSRDRMRQPQTEAILLQNGWMLNEECI